MDKNERELSPYLTYVEAVRIHGEHFVDLLYKAGIKVRRFDAHKYDLSKLEK